MGEILNSVKCSVEAVKINMDEVEIVLLIDYSSIASKKATETTEKIADSIRFQSEAMQKSNTDLEELVMLAGQLNKI